MGLLSDGATGIDRVATGGMGSLRGPRLPVVIASFNIPSAALLQCSLSASPRHEAAVSMLN